MTASFAVRGRVLLGASLVAGAVVIRNGTIAAVLREPRDGDLPAVVHDAPIIAPGFVDMQINGGYGVEVGVEPDAIATLAARLPESGVTAFLPTLVTSPLDTVMRVYTHFAATHNAPGACPLGLHLEGPFLSPARRGAHRGAIIAAAHLPMLDAMLRGTPPIRLMTVAPERADAPAIMQQLRERGIVLALGHTDATYAQYLSGIDAGATIATHLYNAMSPFAHRAPGAIGAALTDDRLAVCLIADGIHAHPAALALAFRAKGVERVALVTDMMPATGIGDGVYRLGAQQVMVVAGAARLSDGTLAGSVLRMDEAVRNAVAWMGATPADALRMASEVPARLLGLPHIGRIAVGCAADLVLLDATLHVQRTLRAGETIYERRP